MNPFVGLRSFSPEDAPYFHGRKQHTQQLLRVLAAHRFVGVVGTSGSGKSSLVKAGLLPALYRGYLQGASSRWKTAVFRPGAHPLQRLAEALCQPGGLGVQITPAEVAALLATHSAALADIAAENLDRQQENLLIVVNQFEEIFRQRESPEVTREAAYFVSLLLRAATELETPVYVVLTMRSEFLGECARHPGLPEALSEAQYLIPRLTREQLEEAIRGPLAVVGRPIEDALVQQLLNDAGHDPDQLPALQHALMKLYEQDALTLAGYRDRPAWQVGRSLDTHARELHDALPGQPVAKVFRALTTVEDGREIRRPVSLTDLQAIVGTDPARVVEAYARRENSLLVVSPGGEVDITHESLIRQWGQLRDWVKQEAESAEWFRRLADSVRLWEQGQAGLWRNPDLTNALKHQSQDGWNAFWAAQYRAAPAYRLSTQFLSASQQALRAQEAEAARRQHELDEARQQQLQAAQESAEAKARELETAQQLTAAQQREIATARQVRQRLLLLLSGLALAAIGLGYSTWRWREAEKQVDTLRQGGSQAQLDEISRLRNELAKVQGNDTGRVKENPKDGLRYVFIPAGEFRMGCSPGDTGCSDNESTQKVRITKGFWIGQTEVTQAAYQRVIKANPSEFKGADRPVERVDWHQAARYCTEVGLGLPSEAEWEYAARAGSAQARYGPLDDVAWYRNNSQGSTQPVASKRPNAWGLYDTLGNVWEWAYPTQSVDPTRPATLRGGSWDNLPADIRVSSRIGEVPRYRIFYIGFRCSGEALPDEPFRGTPSNLFSLSMSVRKDPNGFNVTWDRSSPAVRSANRGVMHITDGLLQRDVELKPVDLRNGSVIYRSDTGNRMVFQLELLLEQGNVLTETYEIPKAPRP